MYKEKSNKLTTKFQKLKSNHAITLIALIVTIVVMLILLVVTLTIALGDNGILNSTKEAAFKTEVTQLKEQYDMNLEAAKMDENFKAENLYVNKQIGNLKYWMPGIQEKYEEKLHVEDGIMYGNEGKLTDKEINWLNELGISTKQVSTIETLDVWTLGTTDSTNDTILKYNGTYGSVGKGYTLTIPNKIIDSTTGMKYDIKYVGDGTNPVIDANTYSRYLHIKIEEGLTLSEKWCNNSQYLFQFSTEDNVVIKDMSLLIHTLSTEKDRINIGNNVTIEQMTLNLDNTSGDITIGNNCKLEKVYWEGFVDNIIIGNNSQINRTYISSGKSANIDNIIIGNNSEILQFGFYAISEIHGKLTVGENVKLGRLAFKDCTGIKEVIIKSGAQIGERAFEGCTGIESLTIEEGAIIEKNAFNGCTKITEVTIPENTSIGERAFNGCIGIEKLTIEEGAIIGEYAFNDCTKIPEVIIPQNASVDMCAFQGCTGITKATIEDGAIIEGWMFPSCTSLKEGIIGNAQVFDDPFGCDNLEKLTIKDGAVLEIYYNSSCETLKTLIIGNNVTIGDDMFWDMSALEKITIGNGTKLGERAFNECIIKEIVIGNCTLSETAFLDSTIETIRIDKTKAEVGELAPWGANAGVKVIYSDGEEVTY